MRNILGRANIERDAKKLRALINSVPTPVGVTDHGSLSGLADDDHAQYVHLTAARTIPAAHTFQPAAPGVPFILGANAQNQMVTGLLADGVNKQVIAGNGLTGGGSLASADATLAVGAGTLISVAADSVSLADGSAQYQVPVTGGAPYTPAWTALSAFAGTALNFTSGAFHLDTPGTLSVASANQAVDAHTHAITTSSNPGAAASILATDASGYLTLTRATLTDLIATNVASSLIPSLTDTYDLGSSTKLWRKGWLSEMDAVLFAQNTITLLGGWFIVGKDEGTIAADVAAVDTSIDFGKAMTNGHFVVFRSSLAVEYVQVGTLVSGTRYNVTRNLDGSGANAWPSGSVFLVLGITGDGRIELNSYDTPRIQIVTQGATYNAQTELTRLGDLNGNWGYVSPAYGLALGEYAASKANMTWDPTNGLRLRTFSTTVLQLDQSGNADITGKLRMPGASSAIAIGSTPPTGAAAGTGIWIDRTGFYGLLSNDYQVKIDATTGALTAGAGNVVLDAAGIHLFTANIVEFKYLTERVGFMGLKGPGDYTNVYTLELTGYRPTTNGSAVEIKALTTAGIDVAGILVENSSGTGAVGMFIGGAEILHIDSSGIRSWQDIRADGDFVSYKNSTLYTGYLFVPLTTPLTSTSWDGDAYSDAGPTTIDLSAVFGVPAGVKAVLVQIVCRDSVAFGATSVYVSVGPDTTYYYAVEVRPAGGDMFFSTTGVCPCDANGDIAYRIAASGAGTMDVYMRIWGYYI